MTLIDKIREIRLLLKNSKNPFMFFDADSDGSSSLFLLKRKFPNLKSYAPLKKNEKALREIILMVEEKHDLILFFDTPVLEDWFLDYLKMKKIVWVDHHIGNDIKLISKYNLVHLNPLNYNLDDSRSASYFAYKIANCKENLFFCVLGTLADSYLLTEIIQLYNYYPKEFAFLFKISLDKRKQLFEFISNHTYNSKIYEKKRRDWIDYLWYECNFIKYKNYFELLYKFKYTTEQIKHLNTILKLNVCDFSIEVENGKSEYKQELDSLTLEYKTLIKKAIKNSKGPLIYFEHTCENSFSRQISEELSYRSKKWKVVMVVYHKEGKPFYSASLRGNFFDVEKMLQECLEGLKGTGGGHKGSAGVGIDEKDFFEFKKKIFKYIEIHNE